MSTFQQAQHQYQEYTRQSLKNIPAINTISTHLSKIRAIYNEACLRYNYKPDVYPFKKGLVVYEKTRKKNLDQNIIILLRDLKLEGVQARVRDLFLLSFYMRGLDVIDIMTMELSDIEKGYLITKRKKLGEKASGFLSIKIEPEAQVILDRYMKPGTKYLLPFFKYDFSTPDGFKKYKSMIGNLYRAKNNLLSQNKLEFEISFKSIRHTWATQASQCNISYDVLQACLGHTNSDVTDIYIEYNQKQLDDANRKVIDAVFN